MSHFSKILELSRDGETVKLANKFKKQTRTHLKLGMSDWVIKYGSLSDGHLNLTDAQRYYGAINHQWTIYQEIGGNEVRAIKAQADLIDAKKRLKFWRHWWRKSYRLRTEALILQCERSISNILLMIEDQRRQWNAFNEVREELKDKVETRYPLGYEQAEEDNWIAVAEFKHMAEKTTKKENMRNVPLPPLLKAKLGYKYARYDMIAPLYVSDREGYKVLNQQHEKLAIEAKKVAKKMLEQTGRKPVECIDSRSTVQRQKTESTSVEQKQLKNGTLRQDQKETAGKTSDTTSSSIQTAQEKTVVH